MKNNLIIISFTVLVLAITVFLAIDLHQSSKQEVVSKFNEYQLLHAYTLAAQVEAYLSAREQGLRILSTFESIRNFNLPIVERNFQEMLTFIRAKGVESISLYDSNGVIVASTNQKAIGRKYREAPCFQWAKAKENRGKVYLNSLVHPYGQPPDTSQKKTISTSEQPYRFQLILPLYREVPGKSKAHAGSTFIGLVSYTITLDKLLRYDQGTEIIQANHNLWIIDFNGTLIYQSEHPEMAGQNIKKRAEECSTCHQSFDYADEILSQKEGTLFYQVKDQPKKLAAYARMEYANASWIFVLNIPYDRITIFAARSFQETMLLLGIVAIALAGGSTLLYRNYRLKVRAEEEAKQWREKHILEEEIIESEKRYKYYIEHIGEGIWCFEMPSPLDLALPLEEKVKKSFQAVCIECNQAYASMYGLSREKMLGRKLYEMMPYDDEVNRSYMRLFFESNYRLDNIPSHEFDKQGKEKWFLNSLFGVIVNAKLIRAWGKQRDITEEREAENKVLELNRQNKMILGCADEGIFGLNLDGIHTFVNPSAARMLGYEVEELIGKPSHATWHYARADGTPYPTDECSIYEALLDGKSHKGEEYFLRKDGSGFFVDFNTAPIIDNENVVGTVVTFRDITDRKQAEESLRKQEERHKKVIENIFKFIPEGVLVFSDKMKLFNQNKAFDDIVRTYSSKFGCTEEELREIIIEEAKKRLMGKKRATIKIEKKTVKI